MLTAQQIDGKPMLAAYRKIDRETFRDEAERTYRKLQKRAGLKAGFGSYSAGWLQLLEQYLAQRTTEQLIRSITATTQKNIVKMVQEAIMEGIGQDDLAWRIEWGGLIDGLTFKSLRSRSRTIARTERNRASNAAHRAAADESTFEVDLVWNSDADSPRTRGAKKSDKADHVEMDRQVAVNGIFTDPRNGDQMGYPGDISLGASPASTINCRCRLTEVPRRDANGRLIMKNQIG
jgi:hypothetical protein